VSAGAKSEVDFCLLVKSACRHGVRQWRRYSPLSDLSARHRHMAHSGLRNSVRVAFLRAGRLSTPAGINNPGTAVNDLISSDKAR
jgi:hypothetical protein